MLANVFNPLARPARTCVEVAALCLVLAAGAWLLTVERIRYEREEATRTAIRDNANLALAFEEHTIRTIRGLDRVVRFIRQEYREHRPKLEAQYLIDEGAFDQAITSAGVVDRRGELLVPIKGGGGISVADRDYFQHHSLVDDDILLISGPVHGRITGRPTIHLSRRIGGADGSFAGVAIVGVDPEYFAAFYSHLELGPDGLIVLADLQGTVLARRTDGRLSSGHDIGRELRFAKDGQSAGSLLSDGGFDGVRRHISYRVTREFPLLVAVGTSREQILETLAVRERNYVLGAWLATALIVLFGALLLAARRRQERALAAMLSGEMRYRATFDQASVGIAHAAPDGRFLKVNRKLCEMLGYEERELLERSWADVTDPQDYRRAIGLVRRMMAEPALAAPEIEKRYRRKDGERVWGAATMAPVRGEDGKPEYFVTMLQDIGKRKQAQEELQRRAQYDGLTGLPNRLLCFDRLRQALGQAQRKRWTAGVLFIDLDRFKIVSDTLGNAAGDALLKEAGRRLAACVRAGDTVARVGGDEFVVVLAELARQQDAAVVAQKIVDAMARPVRTEGRELVITASLGIAAYPPDGADAETLVKNAEAAMFRAKELGRNNFQFYAASMNERTMEKLLLETDLRGALERGEFFLHYQPKVSLSSGAVTGMEALLRWQRPGRGLVSPAQFVPVLEDCGLIVPVGDWIIDAVCAQIGAWRGSGLEPVPVAVNLSARQFVHHDIAAVVEQALARHALDASLLEVEITESDAMSNPGQVAEFLRRLKRRGMRVAIDDFGTGYSSLGYLKRFPLDTLKLDRSFVTGLPWDGDDVSIALAVIGMAHSLGLKVVAEGVEKAEQREFLAAHGCDQMQGYLYSPPVAAAQCAGLLVGASPMLAA